MTRQGADVPATGRTGGTESSDDPEVIRQQIEATRADLGQTVEALAAKADVKAQLRSKMTAGKENLKKKGEEATAKLAHARHKVAPATPDQAMGPVAGSFRQRIMERPLPAVVVAGVLLGWLIWKRN